MVRRTSYVPRTVPSAAAAWEQRARPRLSLWHTHDDRPSGLVVVDGKKVLAGANTKSSSAPVRGQRSSASEHAIELRELRGAGRVSSLDEGVRAALERLHAPKRRAAIGRRDDWWQLCLRRAVSGKTDAFRNELDTMLSHRPPLAFLPRTPPPSPPSQRPEGPPDDAEQQQEPDTNRFSPGHDDCTPRGVALGGSLGAWAMPDAPRFDHLRAAAAWAMVAEVRLETDDALLLEDGE